MADGKNALGMDHKTTCWFAYIISFISGIIVLASVKDDSKARLHAWQSLILGIVYIVFIIIVYIIMAVAWRLYGLWLVFSIISYLAWIDFLILSVICILKATQDDIFKIPVIYNFAEKQK